MNKGFGNSTQTVDQLIKNQIKQNKFLCSEVSNGFRRIYEEPMWSYIPTFRKHVSKEDVVNPYKSPLEVWEGFNADYTNPDDEFTYFTSGKCGIWFLRTFRHKEFNFYDFDSIFATPRQASLFPSPYAKIQQPRQTPSGFGGSLGLGNIFAPPANNPQQLVRRAKGGLIDTTTNDLLRIVGGK